LTQEGGTAFAIDIFAIFLKSSREMSLAPVNIMQSMYVNHHAAHEKGSIDRQGRIETGDVFECVFTNNQVCN